MTTHTRWKLPEHDTTTQQLNRSVVERLRATLEERLSHHLIQFRYDGDRPNITATGIAAPALDGFLSDTSEWVKDLSDLRNIFFTVSSVTTWKKREFESAKYIGFDIDPTTKDEPPVTLEAAESLARIACESIQLDYDSTGVVLTGHGIQLIIELDNTVTDKRFYAVNKAVYDGLCTSIDAALGARALPYRTDRVVFDPARLFRLPGTINAKPGRAEVQALCLQSALRPQALAFSYDYENTLAFRMPDSLEWMNAETHARTKHLIDTATVLRECQFLVDNAANASSLPEPRWFREAGLLAFMPDGDRIFHERSLPHPDYSQTAAQQKLEQVRARQSGPVSCQTINACWGGCQACPHYGRVKFPVHIQPPNIIPTEQWGFYKVTMHEGVIKKAVIQPDDLVRKFAQDYVWKTLSAKEIFTWNGTHYERMEELSILGYAEAKYKHPMGLSSYDKDRREFLKKVVTRNIISRAWFESSTKAKLNFKNGVLNVLTSTFSEHSSDYGFTYVLDYEFDAHAACPTFERFMDDITCGREDLKEAMLEYLGYCASFDEPWLQKAAIFLGDGENGKSTLVDVIMGVLGKKNVSHVELQGFNKSNSLVQMIGKAVNFSRECSPDALERSETFKKVVTGEPVEMKLLYEDSFAAELKAKQIILGNDMPKSSDKTRGLTRRLLIFPFDASFKEGQGRDPFMKEKLLLERAGILNRLLKSYANLKARGRFESTLSQAEMLEQYEFENDNVYMCIKERWQVYQKEDPMYLMAANHKSIFYPDYRQFCESTGTKPANEVNFWKRVRRRVPDLNQRMFQEHGGFRKLRGVALLERE